MGNLRIPEDAVNQIVHEYKQARIDEVKSWLSQLEDMSGWSDVIVGRARALKDVITMLEERNWYKVYNIAVLETLSNRQSDGGDNLPMSPDLTNKEN